MVTLSMTPHEGTFPWSPYKVCRCREMLTVHTEQPGRAAALAGTTRDIQWRGNSVGAPGALAGSTFACEARILEARPAAGSAHPIFWC